MGEDSITVEILKSIRDEMRGMREAQDGTNSRLDRTNERLDRVVQEQIRHATAIVDLEAGQRELVSAVVRLDDGQREIVDGMKAIARELHGLNERIDNVLTGPVGSTVRATSERVDGLEERVEALEAR